MIVYIRTGKLLGLHLENEQGTYVPAKTVTLNACIRGTVTPALRKAVRAKMGERIELKDERYKYGN